MALQTADFDAINQIAADYGWSRTGLFRNIRNDRCIRARWVKGSGRSERVLYFGVNVDDGEVVDARAIAQNRLSGNELSAAAAVNFLKSK